MAPRRWLLTLAAATASIRPERIPVLDLKRLNNPDQIEALGRACSDPGFFHVINHGVPRHVIDAFEAATRAFFALPTDVKRRVKRTATNSRGFADDEFTKRNGRRPVVLWCLHAIDATRLQERRSWVVSFSILSRFGPHQDRASHRHQRLQGDVRLRPQAAARVGG